MCFAYTVAAAMAFLSGSTTVPVMVLPLLCAGTLQVQRNKPGSTLHVIRIPLPVLTLGIAAIRLTGSCPECFFSGDHFVDTSPTPRDPSLPLLLRFSCVDDELQVLFVFVTDVFQQVRIEDKYKPDSPRPGLCVHFWIVNRDL